MNEKSKIQETVVPRRCKKGTIIFIVTIVAAVIALLVTLLVIYIKKDNPDVARQFSIDYEHDTFLLDGNPFRYVAGSFHYFRALPQTWRERLRTLKAGGLNAVDIYIHWALHNPDDGIYNWSGIANVENFIQIAKEEELFVILRPGPYICAEIDNGGLPYWLASKYPDIKLRTSDSNYLFEVERWYSKLMPQFKKHWYGNGGNIIMVQIENEYGAFGACDTVYKEFLRDETLKYIEDNAIPFTVDWPYDKEITCGSINGVFITIDFGLSTPEKVDENFAKLREYQPNGPLVNTEFYTGWFTLWQGTHARTNTSGLTETLEYMLSLGANVDFYVYFGGSNFGFWSGADARGIGRYMPDITSYDYDAPMDEAGNPTDKFTAFRDVIKKYIDLPAASIPEKKKAMVLDAITMSPVNSILSAEGRRYLGTRELSSNSLLTFEELRQFSGFVLYEATLPLQFTRDPANLIINDLRDRAHIYIDGEFIGILSRENQISSIPISYGVKLSILVENQGRLNFGVTDDYKGIRGTVEIQNFHDTLDTYTSLTDWNITGFPFDNYVNLENLARISTTYPIDPSGIAIEGPIVLYAEFLINENDKIFDTYWDTTDWGKGFIFVNGFNLGRFWSIGPQITMYIPKDLLKHGKNDIYIVEMQETPINLKMIFVDKAIFINDENV